MMQIVLIGHRRRRGRDIAVRVGRVRIAGGDLSVLPRTAADPDRRARLEPLGRLDRGHDRRAGDRDHVRIVLRLASRSSACRRLVARLSVAAGAADRQRWRRVGGMVSGRPPGALVRHHRHADRGRGDSEFRHRPGEPAGGAAQGLRTHSARPGQWSTCWSSQCRRRRRCSPRSPTSSISGLPDASSKSPESSSGPGRTCRP